ncbi:syntaxin-22-like [Miscanthus floridulus]|uniref:syntaxin-22-like n=1 Tax=Miscanthus floridulus TaxID=154761 RepID=UPI0034593AA7
MSFADLEAGALRAPLERKARGGSNDARALVFQITTAVASYRRLLNSLGTPKDTPTLRDNLNKTSQNILQLAKDAKDKLQKTAEADKSTDTSADKRIADMKLAKDFAATMEEFRKLQSLAIQRETAYKPVVPQNAQSNYTTDDRSSESGNMPEQRALLAESKRQEVLQLDNEVVFNEAIIEEREQAIQEIQQQIGEVHEVFKDLATLVHAQGIIIEEIDMNIDNSEVVTRDAKKEVTKAAKTQKSNSSLICLLMVIFGVVLLVVIIVLAA